MMDSMCHTIAVEHVIGHVTSVTADLQQLSIQKEDRGLSPEDNGPSVVIPDHLQVQSADCSHLSFGSFGSGISPAFSGPLSSIPVNTNVEEEPVVETEAPSVGHSETMYKIIISHKLVSEVGCYLHYYDALYNFPFQKFRVLCG